MRGYIIRLAVGLAVTAMIVSAQQSGAQAPIASNPAVELKGKITKVQITHGQGMPYLEVETSEGTSKVVLGSMRYLMQQNFNPKAGEEVVVKGYKMNGQVVAGSVSLPAEGRTLKLRDDQGRPVWMGGRHGRRGGRGGMHGKGSMQPQTDTP